MVKDWRNNLLKASHKFWRYAVLLLITFTLCLACNLQSGDNTAASDYPTLIVGNSPWPGFVAQFVAEEKGYYAEEGVNIEENFFQVSTDVNTALLTGKLDVAWTGVPDMVVMANQEPSIRLIAVSDYSDGADGILAKDVNKPEDLLGKTIAWEELPLQSLLLEAYLKDTDITFADLDLKVMPAAEAATAFAAKRVDVAITFEPWLTTAVQEGEGEVVFSSVNTNLIAGGLVGKSAVLETHNKAVSAYFKALERGFQFYKDSPDEALAIVANKLNLDAEELPPIMEKVRLFAPSDHKAVVFNEQDALNIIDSIDFAAKVGKELDVVNDDVDPSTLYDATYTSWITPNS